jgi:hypothetical protein
MAYLTYSLDFPKYSGLINGLVTAAFDLSALIYFLIDILYFKYKFSISLSFIILGCFGNILSLKKKEFFLFYLLFLWM